MQAEGQGCERPHDAGGEAEAPVGQAGPPPLPATLEAILARGERGMAAEHACTESRSVYYLLAKLVRCALLQEHGVPFPSDGSLEAMQRASNDPGAWRYLYQDLGERFYGERMRDRAATGAQAPEQ
jgi:hypothetical protein